MSWLETDRPLARQLLWLMVGLVVVLVLASLAVAAWDARNDARQESSRTAVAVARSVADSPTLLSALAGPDPSRTVQPYAEDVRRHTGVDFVVVMGLDRTRYSHPTPARLGGKFIGDLGDAPQGGVFTQQYTGTLGPSVRAVVPVQEPDGEVVALVSVGITTEEVRSRLLGDLLPILLVAGVVLGAGLFGSWLITRRFGRQTHGLGAREITRMFEYYSAVLHAVREGLLLVDADGRVQLVNDESVRLLDLPADVVGRRLDELGLPPGLVETALGDRPEADEVYVVGDRMLVVSSSPAVWQHRDVGAVVTLRDHTELRAATGELDVVRGLTEALRAQTHEAANRLHTVVALVEMGREDEAVEFATEELQVAQLLADEVTTGVADPVLAALLLGKSAQAMERGIVLDLGDVRLPAHDFVPARDLVTVLGNLLDNAMDAVATAGRKHVALHVRQDAEALHIRVDDSGPGIEPAEAAQVLEMGWTTKASGPAGRGIGLALVAAIVRRHQGDLKVERSELGGASFSVVLKAEGRS